MESIFRGIEASSQHNDALKEQFLEKLFVSLSDGTKSHDEIEKILKLCIEWILVKENKLFIRLGHTHFCSLARQYSTTFHSVVNANFIINIFTNAVHVNKAEIPILILEIASLLTQKSGIDGSGEGLASREMDRSLINVARNHLVRFFKEHGVRIKVAANIARLYQTHLFLLPNATECHLLSKYVVKLLAGFPTPEPVTKEFISDADHLSSLLPILWNHTEKPDDAIQECLRHFYTLMASSDSYCPPSCALLSFLDKTPQIKLEACFRIVVEQKAHGNEGETVQVLKTMIHWVCSRPSGRLSEWLLRLLKRLQNSNKKSVLVEIAHLTIEKLYAGLTTPEVQEAVEPLFFYLLLGFQHSEAASFFKIAHKLPETMDKLTKAMETDMSAVNSQSRKILEQLVEAVYFFAEIFPTYTKVFEPLLSYVEKLGYGKPITKRIDALRIRGWFSEVEVKPETSRGSSQFRLTPTEAVTSSVLQQRSETGKLGLVNLGNTCYCNSIIQALFMTTQFYDCVMNAPKLPGQTVLHTLQQTFAFLRHSMRSIYSPAEFVRASRPPWFEVGRQQDCSEFLRYLLDTLHEQERRSQGLPSSISSTRDHRIKLKDEAVNGGGDEADGAAVKPSCSSSALDAISEAPEDEDMISQGSGVQMEVFGSRSSLGVDNAEPESEADEAEEAENILGSRGSLSGLKRWTTEENLSGDSRDVPIHDSYSNSTDSGIQSVGDSIRGSSDSMSNGGSSGVNGMEVEPSTSNSTAAATSAASSTSTTTTSEVNDVSIEQRVFGGRLQTTYKCSQCSTISIHRESFNDILLPFPADDSGAPSMEPSTSGVKQDLTMQMLLDSHLQPERLDGENKYHCEKCSSLEEADKTIDILEPPNHLKCTLMRFKYDRETGRKRKILTDIKYELTLMLPCGEPTLVELEATDDEAVASSSINKISGKHLELFSLYAIVVHSGISSDSGHYFTYAREPKVFDELTEGEHLEESLRAYNQQSQWYIFNDSQVTFTTFEAFLNMTKRFHSDTAYVLFYQRFRQPETRDTLRLPLRADLQLVVERDNIKFMRDKERSGSTSSSSASTASLRSVRPAKKDDDSDEDENGSGPGSVRGCGDSGFNSPGRFVC